MQLFAQKIEGVALAIGDSELAQRKRATLIASPRRLHRLGKSKRSDSC